MQRQKFSREFNLEAVKLVKKRGVTIAQTKYAIVRYIDGFYNPIRRTQRSTSSTKPSSKN